MLRTMGSGLFVVATSVQLPSRTPKMLSVEATGEQVIVSSQVNTIVRDELLRRARKADRSLSAEIRRALAAHVERVHEEER